MRILHQLSRLAGRPRPFKGTEAISLRDLPDGAFGRVTSISSPGNIGGMSGPCCAQRLEALGLRVGKIVEKVSGMPFHGPVTLILDGRQIAVGWNISSNVFVVPIDDGESSNGRIPESN